MRTLKLGKLAGHKQQPIVKVECMRPKTDKFRLQSVKLKTYRTGGEGRNTKEIHASRVKL